MKEKFEPTEMWFWKIMQQIPQTTRKANEESEQQKVIKDRIKMINNFSFWTRYEKTDVR